jgi:hypothetical protein
LAEAVPQPNPEQQLATTASRPARKRTTRALRQRRLADIDPEHVRAYAAAGLSPAEIAATLRCDEERLVRHLGTDITQGYDYGNGLIKRKVHKAALIDGAPWAIKCRWQALLAAEKQAAREQECPRRKGMAHYQKTHDAKTPEERALHILRVIKALTEDWRSDDPEVSQLIGGLQNVLARLQARCTTGAGATAIR